MEAVILDISCLLYKYTELMQTGSDTARKQLEISIWLSGETGHLHPAGSAPKYISQSIFQHEGTAYGTLVN
jgi:hypothetical protein